MANIPFRSHARARTREEQPDPTFPFLK